MIYQLATSRKESQKYLAVTAIFPRARVFVSWSFDLDRRSCDVSSNVTHCTRSLVQPLTAEERTELLTTQTDLPDYYNLVISMRTDC